MTQDIVNAVQGFFEAVDRRDWKGAERLMRDPFHLDYSSFGGGPAVDLAPSAILEGWKDVLPGFEVTHHQLGPLIIATETERVTVRTYVTALHFIADADGGPLWTVVGTYDIALERSAGDWHLSALTFNFKFQYGNARLPELARARAGS